PLARHLGMGMVAAELESLALTTIYPGRATRYRKTLEAVKVEAGPRLRQIRAALAGSFEHHKLSTRLVDRWRPFSVGAARDAGRGLASLYTLDIQVDRAMDAYLALGILHSLFAPIPGKLRDHLYTMSRHGYQALKTTVQAGEYRLRVEITTRKFARFNEAGVLAPGFDFPLKNFRKLMTSLMEGESAIDTESLRLASSQIRVFTPRGEPRILPEGSGVLDFAFDIHEELGLHAFRARINGKTRLLKARLMDGDQVEIERAEVPQVLPKWLEWAITPRARNAIRKYLRTQVQKSQA
ncbi:MAG: bifunctional (p)ppGpp synthetase/guanosine-3',5'-bis(diphosphate) 3'-pyrophosphohydrolase, partial [Deltaproteobacteria bacterium]